MNQSNPPKKYPRRNYYIDKKFQSRFIMKFCLIVAVGSLFTIATVYWLVQHSTTVGIVDGRVSVHTTAQYLLPVIMQTVLIELVLIALAVILMTLFISHKIAGPLYRLKITLKSLGEGNLTNMHLRQEDQLQEVAVAYNEAVGQLNTKVKALQNASSMEDVKKILNTFKVL